MAGLVRNYYYKIVSSLRILLIFIFSIGILILIFGGRNEIPLFAFLCLTVIGFPFINSIGLRKNSGGKWERYILTLPVKRCEIIKSVFATQLITISFGSAAALGLFFASFLFHGFAFYRYVDVLLLFSSAIGIGLIMNAIFLPLSYSDSSDRVEAISIISLLVAIAVMVGLITAVNFFLEKPTDAQLVIFGIACLLLSFFAFISSYLITVKIYSNKDC